MRLQVTCINKRPSHYDPHERIQAIGGAEWKKREDEAIQDIEENRHSFFVSRGGRTAEVVIGVYDRRKYLKTTADGYVPDNLLALPECP